jgi:hypothetical protein
MSRDTLDIYNTFSPAATDDGEEQADYSEEPLLLARVDPLPLTQGDPILLNHIDLDPFATTHSSNDFQHTPYACNEPSRHHLQTGNFNEPIEPLLLNENTLYTLTFLQIEADVKTLCDLASAKVSALKRKANLSAQYVNPPKTLPGFMGHIVLNDINSDGKLSNIDALVASQLKLDALHSKTIKDVILINRELLQSEIDFIENQNLFVFDTVRIKEVFKPILISYLDCHQIDSTSINFESSLGNLCFLYPPRLRAGFEREVAASRSQKRLKIN